MLVMMALMLASPQGCTDVKRECRACMAADGQRRCSNIGIACQPVVRICRGKDRKVSAGRSVATKAGNH